MFPDVPIGRNRNRIRRRLSYFDAGSIAAGAGVIYGLYEGARGKFGKFREIARPYAGKFGGKKIIKMAPLPPTPDTPTPRGRTMSRAPARTRSVSMASRSRSRVRQVRFGKRPYVSKRSKSGVSYRDYKKRRLNKRRSKKTFSVAQRPIVGGIQEEDKKVKKHMKGGIVVEFGSGIKVTGDHGAFLIHSTMPERQVLYAVMMALVKRLYRFAGVDIKRVDENACAIAGNSTYRARINYWRNEGGGYFGTVYTTVYTTPPSTIKTYWDVAVELADALIALSTESVQNFDKFANIQFCTESDDVLFKMDLDTTYFDIDLVSNLVYQNRTGSQEATGSTNNALDVAQEPLFEVHMCGKGTGPISGTDNPVESYFVDRDSALLAGDISSNQYLLAEPGKGYFANGHVTSNSTCNPGVVKQSKLKTHLRKNLLQLFQWMKIFGGTSSRNNHNTSRFGYFKYLWFRKTISLSGGETQPLLIVAQHHWAAGVTCYHKKNLTTVPFVSQITSNQS